MKDPVDILWQDKEIRFDNKFEHLELRRGEFLIDTLSKIEDTKGNNGDNGELQVSPRRTFAVQPTSSLGLGRLQILG
jgi:hypothetical protein